MSKFYDFVEEVIYVEGGYVNDADDSGGATNFGITESTARKAGYSGDIRDITREEAIEIYKKFYWDDLHLDAVSHYYEDLAFELFDTAVNCGVRRSGIFLQRVLNGLNYEEKLIKPSLKLDGIIGPKTIKAISNYKNLRGDAGEGVLISLLDSLQGSYYLSITEQHPKNKKFLYGWALHRLR